MKHSAKAVAKLARERERQARLAAAGEVARGPGQGHTRQTPGSARTGLRLRQVPFVLVLLGVGAGLAVMRGGGQAVKTGTLVVAGAFLAGSLARLVLPDGKAELLSSRRRLVDVALLTALGVGLLIAGLIVRTPS